MGRANRMEVPDCKLQPLNGTAQREKFSGLEIWGSTSPKSSMGTGMGSAKLVAILPPPSFAANGVEPNWNDRMCAAREAAGLGQAFPPPMAAEVPTQAATRLRVSAAGQKSSPLKAKFDSQSEKVSYFLTKVWNYMEQYGAIHPDEPSHVKTCQIEPGSRCCSVVGIILQRRFPRTDEHGLPHARDVVQIGGSMETWRAEARIHSI